MAHAKNKWIGGAEKGIAAAQAALKKATADLHRNLASEKLAAQLIRGAVLAKATPRALAAFAQQGKEQAALVDQLLADDAMMKQMLIAGGAEAGKYGPAMEIYTAIQKASPKARDGVFQRLALATSLEHAVPIKQSNALTATDAPATVDPVKRYLHYEKAYLDGELDPASKGTKCPSGRAQRREPRGGSQGFYADAGKLIRQTFVELHREP